MNIFQTLFGGSESHTTSTPVDKTPGVYKALRPDIAELSKSVLANQGPTYSGPLTTPIGGTEQTILDQLMASLGPGANPLEGPQQYVAGQLSGQGFNNPFLNAAITAAQRPTLQGLEEVLSRALPGRFTRAGHLIQSNEGNQGGSSAFDRAAALATRGVGQSLADIATNISFGNYNEAANRQLAAAQLGGTLTQQDVQNTITNLQAQALPRLIQENGIDRGIQIFQTQIQGLMSLFQTIASLSAPHLAQQQESTTSSQNGIFAPIGLSLGGKA